MIARYQKRLYGPLLDRIDSHVEVPRIRFQKLSDERRGESSAAIRGRVEGARERQTKRFAGTKLTCNADTLAPALSRSRRPGRSGASAGVGPTQLKEYCPIDETARQLYILGIQH
jgi:magnesium chelatase family protein